MAESIAPPPPGSGGSLKYGIVGVVLIVGAAALYFGMKGCEAEPTTPSAQVELDAGPVVERSTALVDEELVIPELEPDAGPLPDSGGPRIRYVTRHVGGGGGGNWNCSGAIAPAAARAALSSNNLQFRNCYERQLKKNNQLQGRVQLSMRVGRGGEVTAVQAGGTLRDPAVLSCIRQTAQRIRFPAPQDGACAVVAVPFEFAPRQ